MSEWNSGSEIFYLKLYKFSWYLPVRTVNVINANYFGMYKRVTVFRENLVSVIVSTFLLFMFVDQLLLVDVFSQLYYLTYAKKQQCRTYRYKSLKSWKIDNIDLTQQFSLSIFTDFRYKSIKITWLLSIFIDTDFYWLTTLGYMDSRRWSLAYRAHQGQICPFLDNSATRQ